MILEVTIKVKYFDDYYDLYKVVISNKSGDKINYTIFKMNHWFHDIIAPRYCRFE